MPTPKQRKKIKDDFKALQVQSSPCAPKTLRGDPVMRQVRNMTAYQVAEIFSTILGNTMNEIYKIRYDTSSSVLQIWVASVAIRSIQKGDAVPLNLLLNRTVGAVKEKIEITGEGGGPIMSKIGAMTQEERLSEIERLRKLRELLGND